MCQTANPGLRNAGLSGRGEENSEDLGLDIHKTVKSSYQSCIFSNKYAVDAHDTFRTHCGRSSDFT